MTLIKSISGIRGTIGGQPGENLSPLDIVKFTAAYGTWVKSMFPLTKCQVVLGRDARISGPMVSSIVAATLSGMGIDVLDCGLASTPTVEMAVTASKSQGGIILTASHNPKQWNALKLLNHKGEFISDDEGKMILKLAQDENFDFSEVDELGTIKTDNFDQFHIDKIRSLPLVDIDAIKKAQFIVVIDCVNSVGGIVLPKLLESLGVKETICLYCEPNGDFPHNPEPLPEHLGDISKLVKEKNAHLGFVVDPDVDRLAIINEDGTMFGEEYTLVAVADYILTNHPGNTVSNLSSTRALRDITESNHGQYVASAVGEVNVVRAMKSVGAVIGGEGNGGVIYPELHYGRDALVGIALFLTHLAKSGKTCSELRSSYPPYFISKNKFELKSGVDVDQLLIKLKEQFKSEKINDSDGVKIDFDQTKEWVHIRKSNTEPIVRIYAESSSPEKANRLAQSMVEQISRLM